MSKNITFGATINEIVEFKLNEKERIELVNYILGDLTSFKEFDKFAKKFIKDYEECEKEENCVTILCCKSKVEEKNYPLTIGKSYKVFTEYEMAYSIINDEGNLSFYSKDLFKRNK